MLAVPQRVDGAARQAEVEFAAKESSRGKESPSWENVECMGNEQFIRGMWECFTLKRAEAKKILEDAARERQEGMQGQCQQESLFMEILERLMLPGTTRRCAKASKEKIGKKCMTPTR